MGVDQQDVLQVSRLLGIKFVQNEFVAYQALGVLEAAGTITARSYIVSSFALAGFSNLGSLGIQIGVLTGLAGPKQKSTM